MAGLQSKMNRIKTEPVEESPPVVAYNDADAMTKMALDIDYIKEQLRVVVEILGKTNPPAAVKVLPQQVALLQQQHQKLQEEHQQKLQQQLQEQLQQLQLQQQQQQNQENVETEITTTPSRNVKIRDPPVESVVTFDSTMSPETITANKPAKIPKVHRLRPILTKRNTRNDANAPPKPPKAAHRDRPTNNRRRRQNGGAPLRRSKRLGNK